MQCPRWTSHDHISNLIRCCSINQDPWSGLRFEHVGQAPKAVASVNTQFWLPRDGYLGITVNPLNARLLALFILVQGFDFHCLITSELNRHLFDYPIHGSL